MNTTILVTYIALDTWPYEVGSVYLYSVLSTAKFCYIEFQNFGFVRFMGGVCRNIGP